MKNKSENEVVDKISESPDDVLVVIISRLTWREAVATSTLSTRWRHLYTYITRLSYNPRHHTEQSKDKYVQQLQEMEFPKHMKHVYNFLAASKSCRFIKEFKLHIPCMKGANIKTWLPLVLEREVESIDLRMIYHNKSMTGYYNFPHRTLVKREGGGLGTFPGLKSLRRLSLQSLHVDDRDVELFVSNCTALEHLSIVGSYRLKKVSFVGHAKLEHLEISSSRNLVSMEVGDMMNLVSLTCRMLRPKYSLHLNNVPKLVEFNSSEQFDLIGRVFCGISPCVLDQLVHINVHSTDLQSQVAILSDLPILTNLEHLKLEIKSIGGNQQIFYFFAHWFWRCPRLQKLEMKFLWRGDEVFDEFWHRLLVHEVKKGEIETGPVDHLKEVCFSGFIGCLPELSYSWLLLKHVVVLERLVVQLCDKTPQIRLRAAAIAREHFRDITPPSVKLVII